MVFIKGLLTCFLLFPLNLFSQKLKTNGYDKNVNKWRLETFPVNLKSADNIKMDVSLNAADTSFFLQLTGSGVGTNSLDADTKLVFVLDNDSTVTITSSSVQSIDYGSLIPSYRHKYSLPLESLEKLGRHNLKALRKYSIGGVDDIMIERKNTTIVKELSVFFVGELKKGKLLPVKSVLSPPAFPGGIDAMVNFLNRNLKLSSDSETGEEKKAVIQFTVTADGSIKDLAIKSSAGLSLDNELLRILKRMPKWKPALQNGKQVDFIVTQAIKFYRTGTSLKIQLG